MARRPIERLSSWSHASGRRSAPFPLAGPAGTAGLPIARSSWHVIVGAQDEWRWSWPNRTRTWFRTGTPTVTSPHASRLRLRVVAHHAGHHLLGAGRAGAAGGHRRPGRGPQVTGLRPQRARRRARQDARVAEGVPGGTDGHGQGGARHRQGARGRPPRLHRGQRRQSRRVPGPLPPTRRRPAGGSPRRRRPQTRPRAPRMPRRRRTCRSPSATRSRRP